MPSPVTYIQEVVREIKKVTWPSRQQTTEMTLLVITVSIIVAIYIGLLDFVFSRLISSI